MVCMLDGHWERALSLTEAFQRQRKIKVSDSQQYLRSGSLHSQVFYISDLLCLPKVPVLLVV